MKSQRIYYILFQVFFGLLLWIPIFYEFQRQIGLSEDSIFRIQSYYYLAFIFFEVPTGYLADRFGYKNCLIGGAFLLTLANLTPIVFPSFWGMLGHFAAIAAARSLISGAASAHLYEYLAKNNSIETYKSIEGSARSWSLIVKVLSWTSVGYLLSVNVFLPYWVTAAFSALALFFAFKLIPLHHENKKEWHNPFTGMWKAFCSLIKSNRLFLYMIQGTGIFVMVRVMQVNLYQPILIEKSIAPIYFGWVMSAMTLFEAVGSRFSAKIAEVTSDHLKVAVLTCFVCLFVVLCAVAQGQYLTVTAFCFFSLFVGLAFPIQKQLLNDNISASMPRATLLSLDSIISRAMCALVVWPIGALIEKGQLNEILMTLGGGVFLLVVVINIYLKVKPESSST